MVCLTSVALSTSCHWSKILFLAYTQSTYHEKSCFLVFELTQHPAALVAWLQIIALDVFLEQSSDFLRSFDTPAGCFVWGYPVASSVEVTEIELCHVTVYLFHLLIITCLSWKVSLLTEQIVIFYTYFSVMLVF